MGTYDEKKRELGIYIHVPFCVRKCNYCDFLSAPAGSEMQEKYVKELILEIRQFPEEEKKKYIVRSVFLGGGTPSVLIAKWIKEILDAVYEEFEMDPDAEITIECNPGTLMRQKLHFYKEAGINRLSLGLQSAKDSELMELGRIHTFAQFVETFEGARAEGFENINVDLMSSLPGQTLSSWRQTLRMVLAMKPEHISAYSLIVEPGTPFYEKYGEADELRAQGKEQSLLPSEETDRAMYEETKNILQAAGMERYEISNYSLPGRESVHNSGYWQRREYLGFGLGASSQTGHERWKNTEIMEEYLSGDHGRREEEVLSEKDEMAETMFLGLRMMRGVSLENFRKRFGKDLLSVYEAQVDKLIREGLLQMSGGYLALTEHGIDISNAVFAEFI